MSDSVPRTDGSPGAAADATDGEAADFLVGDAFDRDALALAEESAGIGVWSIDLSSNRVRGTAQFFRIMGIEPTQQSIAVPATRWGTAACW